MSSKPPGALSTELYNSEKARRVDEEQPRIVNHVPMDNADMYRMGEQQQFRRNFKVLAISSFSVVSMMGWVYIPVNGPPVIGTAGTGGVIVIFLANFFGFLSTVLSLAEMSSIAPTAGGQYHWTSEFAPPSMQKFLSYISGWLSTLSWLVGVASGIFLAANLIPVLANLQNSAYHPQPYHAYLITVAIVTTCFLVNGFLSKHLPLLESFVFCFTVVAFVTIVIVLLVLAPTKLTGSEVFQTFSTNHNSTGTLEILAAQVLIFYSLLASDSTAHMAEETQHAAVVIPQAMVWSYSINGVLDFVILVGVCFTYVDPQAYNDFLPAYPFIGYSVSATGSKGAAVGLTSIMIILILLSGVNVMASTSRQVFAFARDDGLPFSRWIAKVNDKTLTPINSLAVTLIFSVLITLIGLGSTVAFNAIVSLQLMSIAGTYQVSVMCLVWRRLYGRQIRSPWTLGRWGMPMNIISIVYTWFLLVYSAMPTACPVTPQNMNWAPVMFGGIMFLSLTYYYVWARKIYQGPVVKINYD